MEAWRIRRSQTGAVVRPAPSELYVRRAREFVAIFIAVQIFV